ncbi:cation:dicarboxylase symporter family transporter [Eubacteriaceae bacterium ES3]|nr:cation:dicarboxylase symporter family transporter [Eubacteriaceae bacterium ES3]
MKSSSFPLSLSSIKETNEMVNEILTKYKCSRNDNIKAQLFVEEAIVFWERYKHTNDQFEVSITKRFKTITLTLNFCGESLNPLMANDTYPNQDDYDALSQSILIGLSSVTYSYENGCNKIAYTIKQKPINPAVSTATALVAGVVLGLMLLNISPDLSNSIGTKILTPISSTFFSFLNAIVIPVLFFSAIGSIFNMENLSQMKRIFRLLIYWCVTMLVVAALFTLLAANIFLVSDESSLVSGSNADLWNQIGTMLFGIIPTNIFQPFLDGNTLQIMFLAILAGIVMLTLKGRFPMLSKFIMEGNLIFSTILDGVCSLMPVIVFISILNMVLSGAASELLGAVSLLVLIIGVLAAMLIFGLLSVLLLEKINPITYLKTVFPFVLIAFSTASSSATFASHSMIATMKQDIRDYVVRFSIPVGVLFNKQGAIAMLLLTSLFIGKLYGITFTMASLIPVVFLCMILSVAVPPSPGMGAFLFTVVFNMLGIPLDGLALAVTVSIFIDYPETAGNILVTNIGMLHTEYFLSKKD